VDHSLRATAPAADEPSYGDPSTGATLEEFMEAPVRIESGDFFIRKDRELAVLNNIRRVIDKFVCSFVLLSISRSV
jgi:hypothetical protein